MYYLKFVQALAVLALIPPDIVEDTFQNLFDECPDSCSPVYDHFEAQYIGKFLGLICFLFSTEIVPGRPRPRRGGRRPPAYAIASWNVNDRLTLDLPKNNNSLEGWNNAFTSELPFSDLM